MFHVEHLIKEVFLRKKFYDSYFNDLVTEGGKFVVDFRFLH